MFVQVTSNKIAAAASKAMTRRAGRGRSASALQVTNFERKVDQTSNTTLSLESQNESHGDVGKKKYHQQSSAHASIAIASAGEAVEIDGCNIGNLLESLSYQQSDNVTSAPSNGENHARSSTLDSKTIANMLMLRKELLLLHQLLDTLY